MIKSEAGYQETLSSGSVIYTSDRTNEIQWGDIQGSITYYPPLPNQIIWGAPKENEMKKGERLLFDIYIIDPEGNDGDGQVIFVKERIIAQDFEKAVMKTVNDPDCQLPKDLEDYDFIGHNLCDHGIIRPKKD